MAIISALSADRQASKLKIWMIHIYAIKDTILNEIYVGMTNNLERRISEHKRGQSKYTKKFKKIILIYKEESPSYSEGRKREKFLKSGLGKEFLRSLKINKY